MIKIHIEGNHIRFGIFLVFVKHCLPLMPIYLQNFLQGFKKTNFITKNHRSNQRNTIRIFIIKIHEINFGGIRLVTSFVMLITNLPTSSLSSPTFVSVYIFSARNNMYVLFAVINHIGNLDAGHYTRYRRFTTNQCWGSGSGSGSAYFWTSRIRIH
jgi:hypothetical protein